MNSPMPANPLHRLHDLDDFVASRYKEGRPESEFRRYDAKAPPVYSKGAARPNVQELKPYYEDLFAEFFLAQLAW
jgi:hypothetical protein